MELRKRFVIWWETPAPLYYNYFFALVGLLLLYGIDRVLYKDALPDVIATILGIFVGLTASGERANKIRRFEENEKYLRKQETIKKIYVAIIDELQNNRGRLTHLLDHGFTDSLPAYLQTTTWAVYENSLGDADTVYIKGLTRIYHKLALLNHVILQHHDSIPLGKGPHWQEYKIITSNALEEIDTWIKLMKNYQSEI